MIDFFYYNRRCYIFFFFSSRRRHTRFDCDWSSDVCSSDLDELPAVLHLGGERQCLAAGAGAEIDDPHARPRVGEQGGNLRALVLDLDEPLLECGGPGQRRALLE